MQLRSQSSYENVFDFKGFLERFRERAGRETPDTAERVDHGPARGAGMAKRGTCPAPRTPEKASRRGELQGGGGEHPRTTRRSFAVPLSEKQVLGRRGVSKRA